ncbi:hypothetical protein C8R45DRAFT_378797 [Mycena sanguinolenta]|nr:hypothetical protein C8R45DRAFT_378797 [Mycena sanguinolenta]
MRRSRVHPFADDARTVDGTGGTSAMRILMLPSLSVRRVHPTRPAIAQFVAPSWRASVPLCALCCGPAFPSTSTAHSYPPTTPPAVVADVWDRLERTHSDVGPVTESDFVLAPYAGTFSSPKQNLPSARVDNQELDRGAVILVHPLPRRRATTVPRHRSKCVYFVVVVKIGPQLMRFCSECVLSPQAASRRKRPILFPREGCHRRFQRARALRPHALRRVTTVVGRRGLRLGQQTAAHRPNGVISLSCTCVMPASPWVRFLAGSARV